MNNNIPWIEKYRPDTLSNLILPKDKMCMLREFFKQKHFPNLLFYGPPGVGKTSTILACAQEYYKNDLKVMVMELNASDDRGIDIVRTKIKGFATSLWSFSEKKPKLIILDEVDGISSLAQSALLVEMEANMANARFCLICNNVHKLNPAIQSRCLRLRFSPLNREQMIKKIKSVAFAENVKIKESGIDAIVKLSHGDMRNALNTLQQLHLCQTCKSQEISESLVYENLGFPLPDDIKYILETVSCCSNIEDAYFKIYNYICKKGLGIINILHGIHTEIFKNGFDENTMYILDKLGQLETHLINGCSPKLQLGSLISALMNRRATPP
jgi:replication factor C subunit 3/5